MMFLHGYPLAELNTMRDGLLQALWIRNQQAHIFETLINTMANGLSINPDLAKEIDRLTTDYVELVIPGSREAKKRSDLDFAKQTQKTLADVAELLAGGGSGKINKNVILK